MKTVLVFFFLIFSFVGKAQNLVVNGDFELYDQCPQLLANFNGYIASVYNPHPEGDSDYYNSCSPQIHPCNAPGHVNVPLNAMGYQYAQSGDGYIGLLFYSLAPTNYRENVVLTLSQPLIEDSIYTISFYVSKADISSKSTDAIMVAFANDPVPMDYLSYSPLEVDGFKMADNPIHDFSNWVRLSKKYLSHGGENYIIIGNFLSDNETAIVESENNPWPCSDIIDPAVNGVYFYIDNVGVELSSLTNMFPNVITPNADGINDRFTNLILGYDILEARIYNRWGNIVYETNSNELNWDGTTNELICDEGVYFYQVKLRDNKSNEIFTKQGTVSLYK